jgi:hypothetical protein
VGCYVYGSARRGDMGHRGAVYKGLRGAGMWVTPWSVERGARHGGVCGTQGARGCVYARVCVCMCCCGRVSPWAS